MIGRSSLGQSVSPRPRPSRSAAFLVSVVLATGLAPAVTSGQAMDASLWVTDGDVTTIVPWGNTIYIGVTFGYVGPNTGGWTETDGVFGQATTLLPRLDGDVTAMVSDGGGGWCDRCTRRL